MCESAPFCPAVLEKDFSKRPHCSLSSLARLSSLASDTHLFFLLHLLYELGSWNDLRFKMHLTAKQC